jgi:diguanylate cyclase (GGDEF)-like protein
MLGALLLSVFPLLGFRLYGAIRTERDLLARERQLQELASQDPLTGILNRRGLELALQEMNIKLYQKKEQTIGVLMLDLDHFKQVNDTFGHDAGDEVLQQISRVLRAEVREGNLLSRWGGEEFILVFANIPEDRLRYVAEKIRAHIESTVRWQDRVVTASIGFALGEAARFQALVKQADLALYQAKQKGRNRVEPIA